MQTRWRPAFEQWTEGAFCRSWPWWGLPKTFGTERGTNCPKGAAAPAARR